MSTFIIILFLILLCIIGGIILLIKRKKINTSEPVTEESKLQPKYQQKLFEKLNKSRFNINARNASRPATRRGPSQTMETIPMPEVRITEPSSEPVESQRRDTSFDTQTKTKVSSTTPETRSRFSQLTTTPENRSQITTRAEYDTGMKAYMNQMQAQK